ncbi:autotransporter outer membrane beta-barrel domain-containing protein [Psychroflexus aestuariivivens]|uniref:leucine-rich repeat domain-containing protein n=1 Tax=Psychroflexus aestuariivivens TaxID=1795040 RepID=UPI000FDA6EFC|nr:leucine-rich repeat domain-containing protein [Psychroflexus aestuariivivens]
MKKLRRITLLFLLIFSFFSCQDDDDFNPNTSENPELRDEIFKNNNFGNTMQADFIGYVADDYGFNKLENVSITIGNKTTTTDRNGMFIIQDANVYNNFAYIKAEKPGYISGSRVVIPKEDGFSRIMIGLIEKEVEKTISSGEISEVKFRNVKVQFSGDFVDSEGDPYEGDVDVVTRYLSPSYGYNFNQMPGSLFAQTASNESRILESIGMASIELYSPTGEPLNINTEHPSIIEFDVPNNINPGNLPETIELWYFDEEVGYWKEEGLATRNGDKYIGEVSHFTWWNLDLPIEYVELCFSVSPLNVDSQKLYNVYITRETSMDEQLIYTGLLSSDSDIKECGFVPKDEELKITVVARGICESETVHEEIIGPYSTDSSENITFSEQTSNLNVTGTVTDCEGNPLSNGYLFVNSENTFEITDGVIDVTVGGCSTFDIDIQIFDLDTDQFVVVDNIISSGNSTINLGFLSTCQDSGGIYNGNVTLTSQDEVDIFGLQNYQIIDGNLNISGEDIIDLSNLSNLEEVDNLRINSTQLQSLDGLNNISLNGSNLTIFDNDQLISLDALQNLTSASYVNLSYNDALNSLSGLNSITNLESLEIVNNSSLQNLNGLEFITDILYLSIERNENLISLDGLENLTNIGPSYFRYSSALIIGGNHSDMLDQEGNSIVESAPNPNLTDFCALENLMVNGNGSAENVQIIYNAYNPTAQDIIDGNCEQ